MAYITVAEFRAYQRIGGTADDAFLAEIIESAQSEIDKYARVTFEGTAGTRYYRQDEDRLRRDLLFLDAPLLSVDTLLNGDGGTVPADGYRLEPRNMLPHSMIRLNSSYAWSFNTDGEIAVAGSWGYSATAPGDIVQATKRLSAYYLALRAAPLYDTTANPAIGVIQVMKGLPEDVKIILKPYRDRVWS